MKKNLCYGHNQTLEGGKLDNGQESTVTQINHQMFFDNEEKKQGAIIRKAGSRKLYILFYYFNKRVEKTTGLNDTAKNRQKVRTWLDRIIEKRDCGKLVFADAFPGVGNLQNACVFRQVQASYFEPLTQMCVESPALSCSTSLGPMLKTHHAPYIRILIFGIPNQSPGLTFCFDTTSLP